ncbi:MAG: amino acid ABC transporter permease [Coriobacteriales bacterium]|nr:amino acid ABC transporter permease [Coriobacteriales bacterium]
MNPFQKVARFVMGDHRYVFLGTSVIAAIGVMFSSRPRSESSFLAGVFTVELCMYWFLMGWLILSAVALVWKLTHWNTYAETSPFTKPAVVRVLRYLSYAVVALTAVLFCDRAIMGLLDIVSASLAQDKNPSDFLGSIIYMIDKSYGIIGQGALTTVCLSVFGTLIAFVLAILLVFLRVQTIDRCDNDFVRFLKTVGKGFAKLYSTIVRGTPMMVQGMLVYFAGFGILSNSGMTVSEIGAIWSAFVAGLVTISLNSTAYMMEVLRGGIESVDPGQAEAARSLGLSQWQAMKKVVFPQGIKNAIPALSNELVVNIKDSSVLSVIGVFDLMFATKTVVGIYFKQVELYVVAAVVYLCLTMVASWLLGKFAKRLSVEPAPVMSVSDVTATVGTVAGTGSSEYSLDKKSRRS